MIGFLGISLTLTPHQVVQLRFYTVFYWFLRVFDRCIWCHCCFSEVYSAWFRTLFISGFGHFRTFSDRLIVVYAALMSLYVTKTVFESPITSVNTYNGDYNYGLQARKSRWRGTRAPAKPHHTTWFGFGTSSLYIIAILQLSLYAVPVRAGPPYTIQ